MASRMDVLIRLHIHIQTLRRSSGRGGERRSEARGRAWRRDGNIILGTGTGTGNEKETGDGNGTRGERASIAETGIDPTVARGSIDEKTTNAAVRLLPLTDPHVHPPYRRGLTRTRKKASKCWLLSCRFLCFIIFFLSRISPRTTPRPPSRTSSDRMQTEPPQVEPLPPSKPKLEPELELEMDVAASEDASRAVRRARRQAILAKYVGIASNTQSVSPSPGPPCSAVQPPQPVSSISDLPSQPHSAVDPPVAPGESVMRMPSGSMSRSFLLTRALV
ncbi:hypothetical protein OG21DRAFT_803912 [Imleria badia]|nr:hypothetical protein OG21DRAFT_803912 [Imleria badia]